MVAQYHCREGHLTWDLSLRVFVNDAFLCFLRQLTLRDKDPVCTNCATNERLHAYKNLNRTGHVQNTYTGHQFVICHLVRVLYSYCNIARSDSFTFLNMSVF
jgi:hypothetical protein